MTDPGVRSEAAGVLTGLFQHLGSGGSAGSLAGGLAGQFTELMDLPIQEAEIFLNMAVQITEAVLKSLEEAGLELVKGLTPA